MTFLLIDHILKLLKYILLWPLLQESLWKSIVIVLMTIKEILQIRNNLRTYRIGLLQTKAYRKLKELTNEALSPFGMSSIEWAFFGLLLDNKVGIRSKELAEKLGVEAPFITSLIPKFEKNSWVRFEKDPEDSRAKQIVITPRGIAKAEEIEAMLRKESKAWFSDLSIKEVLIYIKVIEKISKK